jgi:hypothetical protein
MWSKAMSVLQSERSLQRRKRKGRVLRRGLSLTRLKRMI